MSYSAPLPRQGIANSWDLILSGHRDQLPTPSPARGYYELHYPDQGIKELGWGIISHGLKSLAKPKTSNHLSNNTRRKKAKRAFELRTDKDFSTKYSFGGTGVNEEKGGHFRSTPIILGVLIIG